MPAFKATTHDHEAARPPGDARLPRATDRTDRSRAIGTAGTAARILVGLVLLGSVVSGEASRGWHPAAWALGLLVFPAAALAAARLRVRLRARLRARRQAGLPDSSKARRESRLTLSGRCLCLAASW